MAAPPFVPTDSTAAVRFYASPDHIPVSWSPGRPGELAGRQPQGVGLGYQGPDQGYAIGLAKRFAPQLKLQLGERRDDVVQGLLGVALRRASMFGRAPVMHDLKVAACAWGFLHAEPPTELVALRRRMFEGVGNINHYAEARAIVDQVPDATVRMTPDQVESAFPQQWKELLGL